MEAVEARTMSGGRTAIKGAELEGLRSGLSGKVLVANGDGYVDARKVWNDLTIIQIRLEELLEDS
jgi:hypothetical protein